MRKIFIFAIITLGIMSYSLQDLQVITPRDLRDNLNKINKNSNGEVSSVLGRFGEIPYGKTLNGFLYVHYAYKQESNDWCDPNKFVYIQPDSNMGDPDEYFGPIAIATADGCPLTVKAKNAQNAKGIAIIIVSNGNDFLEELNRDDIDGDSITIPSLIINKDSGDILFNYFRNNNDKRIILSISFKDSINGGKVNMQMYFRSDQVKALHFFNEFEQYVQLLGDKLNFTPVYKYTECLFCDSKDTLDETPEDACFREGKFCGSFNLDLEVENSRLVLLENLRQKCIYEKHSIEKYWNYMKRFSEVCADLNLPTFNKKCSKEVMKVSKIDIDKVEECMKGDLTIEAEKSLMTKDYDLYNKYSVHRYPQIIINDIKYKGNWLAQNVFHFICDGFISTDPVCVPPKVESQIDLRPSGDEEFDYGTLALIIFIILFCMLIIAYCYRRIVNKTIDESIEDRIFKQTKNSVGNYSRMDKSNILTN